MHGVTAGIASVWTHDGAGCWQVAIMALSNVESGGTGPRTPDARAGGER